MRFRALLLPAVLSLVAARPLAGQEAAADPRAIARGKALLVTVTAKDRKVADLLLELEKTTSVRIARAAVPDEAVATLTASSLSLWDAVDQICRGNGKLAWDVSEAGITVTSGVYARPRLATASGWALLLRGFAPRRAADPELRSDALVVGPPGAVVVAHWLTWSELVDDKGTDWMKGPAGGWKLKFKSTFGGGYEMLPEPDPARPFCGSPADLLDAVPGKGAAKIKSCKGVATIRAVVETKKKAELAAAALKKGATCKGARMALQIDSVELKGSSVRMEVALTDAPMTGHKDKALFFREITGKLVLRDSSGGEVRYNLTPTKGHGTLVGPTEVGSSETTRCELAASLPANTTLAAIEIWEPSDVEEVKIPFAFKDVPFVKAK